MIATIVNAVMVLLASVLGLMMKNRIELKYSKAIMKGLALCVLIIGINSALESENTLCVIICMALGVLIGELLRIEDRLDGLGDWLKSVFMKNRRQDRFTEGFMTSTLLFCVGSMAIMGSFEAGINHNYSIILSKSVIDAVVAVGFAATMGVGVCFSSIIIFLYQGALTLIALWAGPMLPGAVIAEMTGVGGLLIIALAINMLGITGSENKLKVGNMLPAIFMPIAYIPLSNWIGGLLK